MIPALRDIIEELTRPPEHLSVTDWAARYADLTPVSHVAGMFRRENSPQAAAVADAIAAAEVRVVSVVACVQSGKSLAPALALSYLIATDPGPALWLDVTDEKAKLASETRLRPLFENCAPVKALFNADKNKMKHASMTFANGMRLFVNGANNRRNLQSRSIRYLFGDETWQWERGRMAEAKARTTAFPNSKIVFFSQAGVDDDDTEREFLTTSQSEWCFRCPRCGVEQPFLWDNLRWSPDARLPELTPPAFAAADAPARRNGLGWNPEMVRSTTRLVCPHCGNALEFSPGTLRALNASARFVPQNPNAPRTHLGFHWNALSTMDWRDLAIQFLNAKAIARRGDISALRTFFQQRLALAWKEDATAEALVEKTVFLGGFRLGDAWTDEAAFDAVRARVVPAGTPDAEKFPPLRFLTVDVQLDYFYFVVRSWSATGDSRLRACGIVQTFDEIAALAARERVFPVFVFIDCGFRTPQVMRFCAEHNFTALRGSALNEWIFKNRSRAYFSPRENIACGNGKVARRHFFQT